MKTNPDGFLILDDKPWQLQGTTQRRRETRHRVAWTVGLMLAGLLAGAFGVAMLAWWFGVI